MRIIRSSFLLVFAFAIFSCSEEEKPSIDQSALPGEWEIASLDYSGTTTTQSAGVSVKADFVGTLVESDLLVDFTSEPNEFTSSGSYTIELETTVAGQSTTTTQEFPNLLMPGTWKIENDKLIVENETTGSQDVTIKELKENSLILSINTTETVNQGAGESTTEINGVYSFSKIQ